MLSGMKLLAPCVTYVTIALLAACGGNVVVDGAGGSGAGGTAPQSTATVSPTGTGAGGASCLDPPPQASLTACGSSGATGSGCQFQFCDAQNNTWSADCTGSACSCSRNGVVICSCALDVAGDICAGAPDCCFTSH